VMVLGLSGRLTQAAIRSPLTPLFLIAALAAGLVALLTIPREEEPQISVPMVDIVVQANGLKAPDAVELVTKPLETIVKAIGGVEHVYSQTQDDRAVVTVRFNVGTNEDDAVLRVNDINNAPVHELGPKIEHHPRFPARVNVGFLQVIDRTRAQLRVWERGAGETQACGTGACAAAVAAISQGWMDSPLLIDLPGGRLSIEWAGPGHPVMMTGPASRVYEGQVRL